MSTTKNILLAILVTSLLSAKATAANLIVNPSNGDVTIVRSFEMSEKMNEDDAYALIQTWFEQGTSRFTRQNMAASDNQSKGKAEVEQEFNSSRPLQSLDPASKRITAKGLVKYFGNSGSQIGVMYIEYYMIVEISDNHINVTINNIKYHHFNRRNYASALIYNWQGGKPIDANDKLGNLINNNSDNTEVNNIANFLSADINSLFADLKNVLADNHALAGL